MYSEGSKIDRIKWAVSQCRHIMFSFICFCFSARRKERLEFFRMLFPYTTDKKLIRVGGEREGGYLIPDDLKNVQVLFSLGVGDVWSFEEGCLDLEVKKAFLADASVDPNFNDQRIRFLKKFVGYPEEKDENYITMEEWVGKSKVKRGTDLILQIDVEGEEYDILNKMDKNLLKRFRIIVIEFHSFHYLWKKDFFNKAKKAFERILEDHLVVHIHANNYYARNSISKFLFEVSGINPILEFTFLRKDRVKTKYLTKNFPHSLDKDNVKEFKKVKLSKMIYKNKT